MIKKSIILSLILLLVCLSLLSFPACAGSADETRQDIVEVTRGDIVLSVTGDGNLSLPHHRQLTFGTSGEITEINVKEGDRVTKGQVLASLDTTSLKRNIKTSELAITTTQLAVTSAEIDLKLAEDTITAAEIDLEGARNSLRQISYPYTYSTFVYDVPEALMSIRTVERELNEAEGKLEEGLTAEQYWEIWHNLKTARENLVNAKELLSRGTGEDVFEQQLLAVKDFWTMRAAQLTVEKAESALKQARDNRDKAALALDKAKNDMANAINNLDKARDELDKVTIVAPFDGLIAKVDAKTGDTLSAVTYSTTTIMEIIDPSYMELKAEVDEIDIPLVKPGQQAIITLDALPDVELVGDVAFVYPLSREESGVILYEVKTNINVPAGSALKAGMSASADIIIDQRRNVLLVPSRAITQDSAGNSILKVKVGEEIEERQVVTGLSDSYTTEIASGSVSAGEMVVIEKKAKEGSGGGIFG